MLLDTKRQNITIHPRPYHQTTQTSPAHYASHHHQPAYYDYENSAVPSATSTPFLADDLDFDADRAGQSLSSSPVSTQSFLSSQYSGIHSSPLSTFDSIPASKSSLFDFSSQRSHLAVPDSSASLFANSDPMQTDTWLPTGHLTPRTAGRFSHQRDSSLSSLGSNGPASPYSHNISNPHIAVTDSPSDSYHGLPSVDDFNYQLVKSYPTSVTHDNYYTSFPPTYASADHSGIAAYPRIAANPKRKAGQGLLPPDHMIGSRPVSVASSIASDSPATPAEEPEEQRRRHLPNVDDAVISSVPKLDRTMTDIYADELYNPNFTLGATPSSQVPISPSNAIFAQRLQAANQHLSAVQSPVSTTSRDKSPFRNGSPLAPMPMNDFSAFPSQQQIREQKAAQDARAAQQQMVRSADASTPQTISPKDAMLEFHEDADANFPLFPQSSSNGFDMDAMTKAVTQSQQPFDTLALDTSFNSYLGSSQLPPNLQVPQQYPFISQPRQQSTVPSLSNGSLATSRMGSTETGMDSSNGNSPQRPAATSADGGTYTCTYHGCTLRFETPALLQKHKREGHRQAHGLGGARRADSVGPGMGSLFNSQAGPHRCDRINPSTGKPCNTIFSRPYDLTRHEDTIHNARKQKVRCDLCTDEKTFSRADALTRHYRVCHPDVEFHGKQRRRGGQSV
ncbi:hypothetical protein B0T16DRAFT_322546 [Cercophora newfieldiana]|uniref:C2H2-type domain-containing protein n=1 Tax=Cercophora newfieldiana TaxID=92897 RepID=A0AA39YET3_9PEZI|nr:hypothetical protein B0T16DRAFT_322546 [Cercophora newfieldiana]